MKVKNILPITVSFLIVLFSNGIIDFKSTSESHPHNDDLIKNELSFEAEVFYIKPNGTIIYPKKNGATDSERRTFKKGENRFVKIRDKGISILRFEFLASDLNRDSNGKLIVPEFNNGTDGLKPTYQIPSEIYKSTTGVDGNFGRLDLIFIRDKEGKVALDSLMHVHGHICDPTGPPCGR